jgi:hypothetical protein
MSELTVSQLIKIIIGIAVVVVVVGGLYLLFKGKILDFFQGLPTGKVFLNLILGM